MKERVGAALSLDKFASAKVSKYDKRKVIQKQMALKAKQVNKYKKLKKRLEVPEGLREYTPFDPLQEGQQDGRTGTQTQGLQLHEQRSRHQEAHFNDRHNHKRQRQPEQPVALEQQQQQQPESYAEEFKPSKKHKHNKPVSQLQRLAEKVAADKADKEQERQQREQALAERQRQQHLKQKQRSQQKHNFFRKTKSGQPVMKYRVDKILAVLESEKGVNKKW